MSHRITVAIPLLMLLTAPAFADTGDSGDTASEAETGETADTGELQDAYTLADRTGEEGGCGFGSKALLLFPGLAVGASLLRRRPRAEG